jgi:hypothetical protein
MLARSAQRHGSRRRSRPRTCFELQFRIVSPVGRDPSGICIEITERNRAACADAAHISKHALKRIRRRSGETTQASRSIGSHINKWNYLTRSTNLLIKASIISCRPLEFGAASPFSSAYASSSAKVTEPFSIFAPIPSSQLLYRLRTIS